MTIIDAIAGIALSTTVPSAREGARLRGAATTFRQRTRRDWQLGSDDVERELEQPIIEALGTETWAQEQTAGAAMTLDEVIAPARTPGPSGSSPPTDVQPSGVPSRCRSSAGSCPNCSSGPARSLGLRCPGSPVASALRTQGEQESDGRGKRRSRPVQERADRERGGRPKGLAATVRDATDLDQLLSMLLGIAADQGCRAADRIRACELLLDRGWGKAATFQPIVDADPLGRSELDRAILDIVEQIRHAAPSAQPIRTDTARAAHRARGTAVPACP